VHEPGSIDVMRLVPRHVACASSCMSMTSFEEGIELHRFAGMFPEQFLTEASSHREPVVTADSVCSSVAFAMISPASSTMFFMRRLQSNAPVRPGIGSFHAVAKKEVRT
jgi:hypothetical protein